MTFAKDLARNALQAAREAINQGNYEMARAALRWARRADSANPRYIHAEAELARRTGDLHEAERLYRRLADMGERAFGQGDIRNLSLTAPMIGLYDEMGYSARANRMCHRIIDGLDRVSAADASILALDRVAELCLRAGRPEDAVAIYEAALARRRAVFGDGHERVHECQVALTCLRNRSRVRPGPAASAGGRAARPVIVWRREERTRPALNA